MERQAATTTGQLTMPPKEHTLNLKKGELFLAVVGHQMEGKEALLQEYFGAVFPPAEKHQFTPLGQLIIDEVAAGGFKANEFVGLFMWPGMENVQAFMGEVDPDRLTKLRMGIWSELKQHMVVMPNDAVLTFREGKVYEVKMTWSSSPLDGNLISRNGGMVLLNSSVAGYEDLGKNESPDRILIIEWADQKSANSFRKMNAMSDGKEEAFYTHFSFPQ